MAMRRISHRGTSINPNNNIVKWPKSSSEPHTVLDGFNPFTLIKSAGVTASPLVAVTGVASLSLGCWWLSVPGVQPNRGRPSYIYEAGSRG